MVRGVRLKIEFGCAQVPSRLNSGTISIITLEYLEIMTIESQITYAVIILFSKNSFCIFKIRVRASRDSQHF